MNLEFSAEQQAARDAVRRLLADHSGLKSARRALDGEARFDRALWTQLGRDGWLGASVPEALGGQALGYGTVCCIAEEVGRSMAAIPFASSAVLATDALVRGGSDAQRREYVPALVRGERIGAIALVGGVGALHAASQGTSFASGCLTGAKSAVSDGMSADFFLVLGEASGVPSLYLVDAGAAGVHREPEQGIDPAHGPAKVHFDRASATPLPGLVGWESIEALLDRAAIVLAFEQLGSADAALEIAVAYAKGRYAFGRPIGSFQAVKHKLAEVYIANELARSNAHYAAWVLQSAAPTLTLAAAAARVSATEALERAARESIQVHGGIGVTWEHDAHLFYRRAQHLALMLGGLREWQYRLVSELARAA